MSTFRKFVWLDVLYLFSCIPVNFREVCLAVITEDLWLLICGVGERPLLVNAAQFVMFLWPVVLGRMYEGAKKDAGRM